MKRAGLLIVLLALAACAGSDARSDGPRVTRTTRGDTTIVRTEAGSVWGAPAHLVEEVSIGEMDGALEYLFGDVAAIAVAPDETIYVLDRQGPSLRAYDPDGRYLRTLGRQGEGPGELKQPDSGLAVLSDGRVVVRDPGNARLQVYGPDGEASASWSTMGSHFTSAPLWMDDADNLYTKAMLNPEADFMDREWGLAQVHPDGSAGDTLRLPDEDFEPTSMTARTEGMSATMGVPFTPTADFALHPEGWFVHGVSTAYRIVLAKPDAPLVIERAAAPVPVTGGEQSEGEAQVTRNMRRMFPDWSWDGPAIPDTKPPFSTIYVGRDGRILVQVAQAGVEEEDPDYDPKDPQSVPDRWREPVALDVFEPDGTYLGELRLPDDVQPYSTPVFDGDAVWAVARDDLGVQRVVRYRVEHGEPPAGA